MKDSDARALELLRTGEPLRIILGTAIEIILKPHIVEGLRRALIRDLEASIAAEETPLDDPDPAPASPAGALPVPEEGAA